MTNFILGVIVGGVLTTTLVQAGRFYDSNGNVKAPSGSIQQFDYFRQRQQYIDIGHLREQADRNRLTPCAR